MSKRSPKFRNKIATACSKSTTLPVVKQQATIQPSLKHHDSNSENDFDEELAFSIYDFIKYKRRHTKDNTKLLYKYIIKVFDDEKEYSKEKLERLGIDKVMNILTFEFDGWFKTEEYECQYKPLRKELLIKYLECGISDDYEEDGWLVNDEDE